MFLFIYEESTSSIQGRTFHSADGAPAQGLALQGGLASPKIGGGGEKERKKENKRRKKTYSKFVNPMIVNYDGLFVWISSYSLIMRLGRN